MSLCLVGFLFVFVVVLCFIVVLFGSVKVHKSLIFKNVCHRKGEPGREGPSTAGVSFEAMRLWLGPVQKSPTEGGNSEASAASL